MFKKVPTGECHSRRDQKFSVDPTFPEEMLLRLLAVLDFQAVENHI
jgi:hypothetical protein